MEAWWARAQKQGHQKSQDGATEPCILWEANISEASEVAGCQSCPWTLRLSNPTFHPETCIFHIPELTTGNSTWLIWCSFSPSRRWTIREWWSNLTGHGSYDILLCCPSSQILPKGIIGGDFLRLILTKDTCLQGFGAVSTLRATCWFPCTLCLIQQEIHTWSWMRAWSVLVSVRRLGQSRELSRDEKNAHSRIGLLRW